jgi:hypothetical protein
VIASYLRSPLIVTDASAESGAVTLGPKSILPCAGTESDGFLIKTVHRRRWVDFQVGCLHADLQVTTVELEIAVARHGGAGTGIGLAVGGDALLVRRQRLARPMLRDGTRLQRDLVAKVRNRVPKSECWNAAFGAATLSMARNIFADRNLPSTTLEAS